MKRLFQLAITLLALNSAGLAQDAVTALWDLALTTDPRVVEKHLPKGAVREMADCQAGDLDAALQEFMLAKKAAEDGKDIELASSSEGVLLIGDQYFSVELRMATSQVRGSVADFVVKATKRMDRLELESWTLVFTMEFDDAEWRLTSIATQEDEKWEVHSLHEVGRHCRMAKESSAVGSLRTINTAQVTYASTYPEHGFAYTLSQFADPGQMRGPSPDKAGLIDAQLACDKDECDKSGYRFRIETEAGQPRERYQAFARPLKYNKTGTRSFYTDQTGVIRFTVADRDATADDPPLN